jgi:hypothetical protein
MSKSTEIRKKTLEKNLIFIGILSAIEMISRIRIRKSVLRISRSEFVSKYHGSTTLGVGYNLEILAGKL